MHDPEVIILDEPTVGLDPKQIIEVRHLIKGLAGCHTVILSTHILPEVGMTCDRVVIINTGKIAAVDTPAEFDHAAHRWPARPFGSAGGPGSALQSALQQIPGCRTGQWRTGGGAGTG